MIQKLYAKLLPIGYIYIDDLVMFGLRLLSEDWSKRMMANKPLIEAYRRYRVLMEELNSSKNTVIDIQG